MAHSSSAPHVPSNPTAVTTSSRTLPHATSCPVRTSLPFARIFLRRRRVIGSMLWFGARLSRIALRIWCCMRLATIVSGWLPYGRGIPSVSQEITTVRHSSLSIFPSRIKTFHDLLSDIRDKKNFFIFPMIFYFVLFLFGQIAISYAHPPPLTQTAKSKLSKISKSHGRP
jgi:hypothetical protein